MPKRKQIIHSSPPSSKTMVATLPCQSGNRVFKTFGLFYQGCNFTMPKRKPAYLGHNFFKRFGCNFTMPKRKQLLRNFLDVNLMVATLPCQSGNVFGVQEMLNHEKQLQLYHAKAETRANLQLYHASATILSIPHFFLYCKLNSTYRDTIQFSHTIGA